MRVPLNIAYHRHQMPILPDRERLEPALPDMPGVSVILEVTTHVCGQQPVHPSRKITVTIRSNHQVKVIGHQAVSQQPHGKSQRRFTDDFKKCAVVLLLIKDPISSMTTVRHMIAITTKRRTSGTRNPWLLDLDESSLQIRSLP